MNHSFLCIVGCGVYPTIGCLTFDNPWDADFDRFLTPPIAGLFDELTYLEIAT
jgi:hypothetical protein